MTSFKIDTHGFTGNRMIEVFDGGRLVAAIYPIDEGGVCGIHIVSKYFVKDPIKPSEGEPPGYIVRFKT